MVEGEEVMELGEVTELEEATELEENGAGRPDIARGRDNRDHYASRSTTHVSSIT